MSAVAASAAVKIPSPRPEAAAVDELPGLYVPEAQQWVSTTPSRLVRDPYSWLQAVHWVAGAGVYQPRRHRGHGPRSFGPTTVRVAQELAELLPCRPGVDYLVRRTGLTERTVQYHLTMLREAGLLAYEVRGTRAVGESPKASEFAWVIPVEFDVALGIRTTGEGTGRRMTGIEDGRRGLMAKLGTKAARKVRKRRSKSSKSASTTVSKASRKAAGEAPVTAVSGDGRCTPNTGASTSGTSAGGSLVTPPESKLSAGGASESPTPKKPKAKARRTLNKVGRRYQLARELISEIDWLRGCSLPRIAWMVRGVADAGWTVTEVRGWLHLRGEAARVRRASGLLATLLAGAETILDTPAKRADAVDQWRAAVEAARRHRIQQVRERTERFDGDWQAPTSRAVRKQVAAAYVQAFGPKPQPNEPDEADLPQLSGLEDLDAQTVSASRLAAKQQLLMGDTSLIRTAIDSMGEAGAVQLYGADLVKRARQLEEVTRSSLVTITSR